MANETRQSVQPNPAKPPAVEPAVVAAPTLHIRFMPPSYPGKKPDERPNVADAILVGAFGTLPLALAEITLQLSKSDRTITIFVPKTSPLAGAPGAIQPLRVAAPDGVETDDGMVLAPGARMAREHFDQAVRDAWTAANKVGDTKWGIDFPLTLTR